MPPLANIPRLGTASNTDTERWADTDVREAEADRNRERDVDTNVRISIYVHRRMSMFQPQRCVHTGYG